MIIEQFLFKLSNKNIFFAFPQFECDFFFREVHIYVTHYSIIACKSLKYKKKKKKEFISGDSVTFGE
jgi:hypothetical protein